LKLRLFLPLVAALVALPILAASAASLPQRPAAIRGAEFIRATQQSDGGFGGFGPGQSMDAIYAIRAAGFDPNTFVNSGNSPADYLVGIAGEATSAGSAAKGALAALALGLDPRDVGGVDFVAVVEAALNTETGAYAEDVFTHALVVISLNQVGAPASSLAIRHLREAQLPDGGWGFGDSSDADTTALAIQALATAGKTIADPDVAEGIAYLKTTQGQDGGWGFDPAESNTSSTAFAVQALLAAGEDPAAYEVNGVDPIDYLLASQQSDGSFPGFDPAFATNQVVPALAGRTFASAVDTPIAAVVPGPPNTGTGLAPAERGVPGLAIGLLVVALVAFVASRRRT
jgi:hypothetical protein